MTVIEISPLAIAALLAFLATAFWKYREEAIRKNRENQEKIDKLTADMALLKVQFSPFWNSVQDYIVKELTHPSPQFREMDDLLHKLAHLDLTVDERARLVVLLKMRAVTDDPEVSDAEQQSAHLMLIVMEKAAAELDRATAVAAEQNELRMADDKKAAE